MENTVSRKIILRLIIPIMVLTVLNSLDRVNISFAALQMNDDLGLNPELYGYAVSIFFVSYLLFQFPSAKALRLLGARWWIFSVVLIWGVSATCMALVQNIWHLYFLRFCLGIAEAGFAPGVVFLCSCWVPKTYRARAIATTMLAIPISVVVGGPLSGWLLSMDTPFGLPGWRWMFFIEGVPAILLAFVALKVFAHPPQQAPWLDEQEKQWLEAELTAEQAARQESGPASFRAVLTDPRILCCAGVWFALIFGSYGIMFWLPLVMQEMTGLGEFRIGLMSALPWLGVGTGMILVSRHSDMVQERFWHVGLAAVAGGLCLLGSAYSPSNGLSLLLLFLTGVGLGGAQGTFWTIPTAIMTHAVAASGVVLINLIGNISSLVNSSIIGYVRETTGSYQLTIVLLSVIIASAAVLVAVIAMLSNKPALNVANAPDSAS
jgi:ACS family tartrate transporter-like MFS transporter